MESFYFIRSLSIKTHCQAEWLTSGWRWEYTIFWYIFNNCNVVSKYLWYFLMISSHEKISMSCWYCCYLFCIFMTEEDATFELEVSRNKGVFCPNPVHKNPHHGSVEDHRAQEKNLRDEERPHALHAFLDKLPFEKLLVKRHSKCGLFGFQGN